MVDLLTRRQESLPPKICAGTQGVVYLTGTAGSACLRNACPEKANPSAQTCRRVAACSALVCDGFRLEICDARSGGPKYDDDRDRPDNVTAAKMRPAAATADQVLQLSTDVLASASREGAGLWKLIQRAHECSPFNRGFGLDPGAGRRSLLDNSRRCSRARESRERTVPIGTASATAAFA
jgi:hypothetical protein